MFCVHNFRQRSRFKFRTIFESSFTMVWPIGFMNHFLQFITISFSSATLWSKFFKGGVLFFFRLCCKVSHPYKANVEEGQICLILWNVFFARYSKMFPPFVKYMPFATFCNGGYNFKVRGFPSKSTVFPHPFFWCSLILICEFFLHLQ